MARPGLMLYFDILPALDKLPSSAVGELLLAALHYAQDGIEPSFEDSSLTFAWAFLRPAIDRDGITYEGKRLKGDWLTYCRQCKKDGVDALDFETWRERVDNGTLQTPTAPKPTTTTSPSTTTTPNNIGADKPPTRFCPPSVEDVKAYCGEKGYHVDAEQFVAFYEAKGWYIGKNKMKNWKQALVTWEKRGESRGNIQQRTIEQRPGDDRDWTAGFHAPDT